MDTRDTIRNVCHSTIFYDRRKTNIVGMFQVTCVFVLRRLLETSPQSDGQAPVMSTPPPAPKVAVTDFSSSFFRNALRADIQHKLINRKVNACPMAMRVAWHTSGTYDSRSTVRGGSDGATMRFEPEHSDDANAGLHIIHDLLVPTKKAFPTVSNADIWTMAGAVAVECAGGPFIDCKLGRTDAPDGASCPENGRLPDAAQGADHLRDVFGRMGFDDREIVALSGGHTVRSSPPPPSFLLPSAWLPSLHRSNVLPLPSLLSSSIRLAAVLTPIEARSMPQSKKRLRRPVDAGSAQV
jgi:hypothetical protein